MPPVIAVVAAGATIAGGMAAVAVGSTLIGGVMIAGGVLSGLGAITGNKTLSKFGMVLGLAGGIGALASGAFEATAGTIAEQSGMDMAADAASGFAGPGAASGMDMAADAASGLAGPEATSGMDLAADGASKAASTAQPEGLIDSAKAGAAPGVAPGAADATKPMDATQAAKDTSTPASAPATNGSSTSATAAGSKPLDPAAAKANTTTNTGVIQQATAPSEGGVWDKLKAVPKWIEANKNTALMGSGLVSGAMKSASDQAALKQKYALQDEFDQKQRARYSNSIIGLRMPASK